MGEARRRRQVQVQDAERLLSLDRLFDRLVEQRRGIPIPSPLYHYTSWAGAEGILRSRELWLTGHECTNDPAELTAVDDTIVACAAELRSAYEGGRSEILDRFVQGYDQDKVSRRIPVFLFCLTASRDDQHFWQSEYTERGSGLCLGFKFLPDERVEAIRGLGGAFIEIDYNEASWRAKLSEHFRMVLEAVPAGHLLPDVVRLGVGALNRIAAFAAIQGKQASWEAEKELRFAVMTSADCLHPVMIRESRGRRVRYLKHPVRPAGKPAFLEEVIIGPRQDSDSARYRLLALLESVGYPSDDAPMPTVSNSMS